MMKSIVLFMPYYGKLPKYFDIWLSAIGDNSTIDFCLITDLIENDKALPANVNVINICLEDFKTRIQDKFDFKISIENLGRISQFRPALAYIFPEVVVGYDYWGFVECDLIPGDIRCFITDEILEQNDKIFKLGHFQVFKNNERMNMLFMKEYKSVLSYRFAFSHNVLFFEELLGMHNIAKADGVRSYTENVFSDIKAVEYGLFRSQYAYPEVPENALCVFEYDNGKLYEYAYSDGQVKKREVVYAHFQKRNLEINTSDYKRYVIVPNRFIEWRPVDKQLFDEVNKEIKKNESEYRRIKMQAFKMARKERYKQLCWWQLILKRKKIVRNGGVDLDGK